jgi:hypothetical protein
LQGFFVRKKADAGGFVEKPPARERKSPGIFRVGKNHTQEKYKRKGARWEEGFEYFLEGGGSEYMSG